MSKRVSNALARMRAQKFPLELPNHTMRSTVPWLEEAPAAATTPARTRRVLPRRTALVAGLAGVAAVAWVSLPPLLGGATAYAATPAMLTYTSASSEQSAGDVLMDLAVNAGKQRGPSGSGPYHYVHQRGWYLSVAADTDNRILHSGVVETEREQWIAADGSGRLRQSDSRSPVSDEHFGPGKLYAGFVSETATPEELRLALGNGSTAASLLRGMADLWNRQVVSPHTHSRLLSILANQPGLTVLGETTDRAGRHGLAIAAVKKDGPAERIILIFSPDTGALLDAESVVLEKSDLPVRVPATTEYTVWLDLDRTQSVNVRP